MYFRTTELQVRIAFLIMYFTLFISLLLRCTATLDQGRNFVKHVPSRSWPQRLGPVWEVNSRLDCAFLCLQSYPASCHGYIYNKTTGMYTPCSGLSVYSSPLVQTEGSFYFSHSCQSYPDFRNYTYTDGSSTVSAYASYYLNPLNFTEAEATCRSMRSHLFVAKSNIKFSLFKNITNPSSNDWIGLNDMVSEGHFLWSDDGQELTSTMKSDLFNWPQPDNAGGVEDCVYKNSKNEFFFYSMLLNDGVCSEKTAKETNQRNTVYSINKKASRSIKTLYLILLISSGLAMETTTPCIKKQRTHKLNIGYRRLIYYLSAKFIPEDRDPKFNKFRFKYGDETYKHPNVVMRRTFKNKGFQDYLFLFKSLKDGTVTAEQRVTVLNREIDYFYSVHSSCVCQFIWNNKYKQYKLILPECYPNANDKKPKNHTYIFTCWGITLLRLDDLAIERYTIEKRLPIPAIASNICALLSYLQSASQSILNSISNLRDSPQNEDRKVHHCVVHGSARCIFVLSLCQVGASLCCPSVSSVHLCVFHGSARCIFVLSMGQHGASLCCPCVSSVHLCDVLVSARCIFVLSLCQLCASLCCPCVSSVHLCVVLVSARCIFVLSMGQLGASLCCPCVSSVHLCVVLVSDRCIFVLSMGQLGASLCCPWVSSVHLCVVLVSARCIFVLSMGQLGASLCCPKVSTVHLCVVLVSARCIFVLSMGQLGASLCCPWVSTVHLCVVLGSSRCTIFYIYLNLKSF
ncbi:hypothetical protein Btru_076568 [Bulinus truncatus]|nr:hypothetical protein Btru_076568 [Bulinus truncatus]